MDALKDSYTVDESNRDEVCQDIEFQVAYNLALEAGWHACTR